MTEFGFPFKATTEKPAYAVELKVPTGGWLPKKEIILSHEFSPWGFKFKFSQPIRPATSLQGTWLKPHAQPIRFEAQVTQAQKDHFGRFYDITVHFTKPLEPQLQMA